MLGRIHARVAGRLRNRPDSEHEQALVRFGVGAIAVGYLVVSALWDGVIAAEERIIFRVAATFFAGAAAIFGSIVLRPGVSVLRRYTGMALDIGATTLALAVHGDLAAPLFTVYLWVTFGNGFRYGRPYLGVSAVLSVVGFLGGSYVSGFGASSPHLVAGLVIGLLILPLYVAFLLRRLTDALVQARAGDEAKSRFLAAMSHEIRTPLHGILGVLDTLLESPLGPEQRRSALLVHRSAEWLLEVFGAVLDLAQLRAGERKESAEDFDLPAAVEGVVEFHREAAGTEGPQVRLSVGEGVPRLVRGDRVKLLQVLQNLLRNAVAYTPHGTIDVTVETAGREEGRTQVRLTVADTGVGMPAGMQERVFEAFSETDETASRRHGGAGLGLAIARELVRVLGGGIELESREGRGTTVRVTVPLGPPREAAGAEAAGQAAEEDLPPPGWQGRPRILVAEDNAVNRHLLEILLAQFGCDAVFCENGRAAVAAALAGKFDLVLMDCQMPELDGYAATRALRERHPADELPIIALTAYTSREHRERCREAGMNDFLGKPFRKADLHARLARWLAPGAQPSPASFLPRPDDLIGAGATRAPRNDRAALHELANVLTGLIGYTDVLLAQVGGDAPLRAHAEKIMASCERAREVLESMRRG